MRHAPHSIIAATVAGAALSRLPPGQADGEELVRRTVTALYCRSDTSNHVYLRAAWRRSREVLWVEVAPADGGARLIAAANGESVAPGDLVQVGLRRQPRHCDRGGRGPDTDCGERSRRRERGGRARARGGAGQQRTGAGE